SNADAAGIERLHEIDEALPFPAETILRRDLCILEDELTRVGRAPAHLVLLLACANAGRERLELRCVTDADALGFGAVGRLLRDDEARDALQIGRAHV